MLIYRSDKWIYFPFRSRNFWPTRPLTLASLPSSVLCKENTKIQIQSFNKEPLLFKSDVSLLLFFVFFNALTCCCSHERRSPRAKEVGIVPGGGFEGWGHRGGGVSDVIRAYPGREGKEGGREREKGSCSISFCVYLSKVTQTFAKHGFEWRPSGHQHAEETVLGREMGPSLAAVVHSWWQHQVLTHSRPEALSDHREESKSLFLLLKKECGGMIHPFRCYSWILSRQCRMNGVSTLVCKWRLDVHEYSGRHCEMRKKKKKKTTTQQQDFSYF